MRFFCCHEETVSQRHVRLSKVVLLLCALLFMHTLSVHHHGPGDARHAENMHNDHAHKPSHSVSNAFCSFSESRKHAPKHPSFSRSTPAMEELDDKEVILDKDGAIAEIDTSIKVAKPEIGVMPVDGDDTIGEDAMMVMPMKEAPPLRHPARHEAHRICLMGLVHRVSLVAGIIAAFCERSKTARFWLISVLLSMLVGVALTACSTIHGPECVQHTAAACSRIVLHKVSHILLANGLLALLALRFYRSALSAEAERSDADQIVAVEAKTIEV